jgi:hypothetical protein
VGPRTTATPAAALCGRKHRRDAAGMSRLRISRSLLLYRESRICFAHRRRKRRSMRRLGSSANRRCVYACVRVCVCALFEFCLPCRYMVDTSQYRPLERVSLPPQLRAELGAAVDDLAQSKVRVCKCKRVLCERHTCELLVVGCRRAQRAPRERGACVCH